MADAAKDREEKRPTSGRVRARPRAGRRNRIRNPTRTPACEADERNLPGERRCEYLCDRPVCHRNTERISNVLLAKKNYLPSIFIHSLATNNPLHYNR